MTEDNAEPRRGCDAISVFDAGTGEAHFRGETHLSPGRLTSDSKGTVALASPTNTERVIYALSRTGSDLARWKVGRLDGPVLATLGAIAILPDDEHVLVTTTSQNPTAPQPWLPNRPPFHLEKYRLPASLGGTRRLTGAVARRKFDALPAVLMPAAGGARVHLLTDDAVVHTLDAATLEEVAAPIPLPAFLGPRPYVRRTRANYMHAALSADGRYVFANRWAGREISVADLVSRTASAVALRPDVAFTGGIAVDHTGA
ncbi:MAG: hypothetical protein ACE5FN_12695, partial [Leptospirillia bacterium]